jgi:hypothetical protein
MPNYLNLLPGLLFGALLCVSIFVHNPPIDETAHLPAGLSHWESGRIQLNAVNPPLIRLLAAIPVYLAGPKYDWSAYNPQWGERSEWAVGQRFFAVNGPQTVAYFRIARLFLLPFAFIGVWGLFLVARELLHESAFSAILLCAISPLMISHTSLITSDAWAGFGGVLFIFTLRKVLLAPSELFAAGAGMAAGYLICTKATWLVLLPLVVAAAMVMRFEKKSVDFRNAVRVGIAFISCIFVINAVYGFTDSFVYLQDCPFQSKSLRAFGSLDISGERADAELSVISTFIANSVPSPLPRSMLEGIDIQRGDFERGFPSYLMGEWKHGGWCYYYLVGFLVKEPIGFQLMLYASVFNGIWFWRKWTRESVREWSLIVVPPLLIFGLVSSQTGFNHHMRYVLPAYPFLFIIAARTVTLGKFWKWFSYACLTWQAAAVLWFAPHWMSYFNEAAGGPLNGHKWLVDSNIDWGQDILGLKWWQDKHPEATELQAALFTGFDPKDIGLRFRLPAPFIKGEPQTLSRDGLRGPQPGWYAISVCQLKGHSFSVPEGNGEWTWSDGHFTYFLDNFEPVDRIGYSIYIYHITEDDAARVRVKLLAEETEFWTAGNEGIGVK